MFIALHFFLDFQYLCPTFKVMFNFSIYKKIDYKFCGHKTGYLKLWWRLLFFKHILTSQEVVKQEKIGYTLLWECVLR